jgi:hypothetical protein
VETKGEEKWKEAKRNADVKTMSFVSGLCFFFSFSFFVFQLIGRASPEFFIWICGLPGIVGLVYAWMSWVEMKFEVEGYQCGCPIGTVTEWNRIVDDMRDMYERSCVFRFCAIKNLNSKKPWKRKNQRVFFGMELLLRGLSESKVDGGWWNGHQCWIKSKAWCRSMDLSAVDGDKTISNNTQ